VGRWLLLATVLAFGVMVIGTASTGRWLSAPAAVPDHQTGFAGTLEMVFAGPITLAQRIVPSRNGLMAVDVVIAAEAANLPGVVTLDVQAWPSREPIRRAQLPAAALSTERVWALRPGRLEERWTTFGFEPVADSARRELLIVLSYAGGVDRPGSRLATLGHFPGRYRVPVMLVNGFEQGGNLPFRLAAAGNRRDALGVALDNLARAQPVMAGTLVFPVTGALTCLAIGLAALGALWRASAAGDVPGG